MIYFTPFFYYICVKVVDRVSNKPISWFKDFIGVGYRYHDVYMNVIPLFGQRGLHTNYGKRRSIGGQMTK